MVGEELATTLEAVTLLQALFVVKPGTRERRAYADASRTVPVTRLPGEFVGAGERGRGEQERATCERGSYEYTAAPVLRLGVAGTIHAHLPGWLPSGCRRQPWTVRR